MIAKKKSAKRAVIQINIYNKSTSACINLEMDGDKEASYPEKINPTDQCGS